MSKINRIRIINLNYNNNTMKIDDETFDFGGESTLLSLRNGGGKTVLVQMIMSLFVHQRYRDFENRLFQSYFTTNKPTFIMTEWVLDNQAGYFLAGMMVRKNQNPEEEKQALEMVTFTGSYSDAAAYDLDEIPVVEKSGDKRILKGFAACKREFEILKKGSDFNYYDMSSSTLQKKYFDTLREYQIDNREWETIIKKVNKKESGLSELFQNAKDERGLIEKWMLDAVDRKLNGDQNKIESFQTLVEKLIVQYRNNQANIEKKDTIEAYFADAKEMEQSVHIYCESEDDLAIQKSKIADFIAYIDECAEKTTQRIKELDAEIQEMYAKISQIEYEKYSYQIYQEESNRREALGERVELEVQLTAIEKKREEIEKKLNFFKCVKLFAEMKESGDLMTEYSEQIKAAREERSQSEEETTRLGGKLKYLLTQDANQLEEVLLQKENEIQRLQNEKTENEAEQDSRHSEKEEYLQDISGLKAAITQYDRQESEFNQKYKEKLSRNIVGEYEEGFLEELERGYEEQESEQKTLQNRLNNKIANLSKQREELENHKERTKQDISQTKLKIESLELQISETTAERDKRKNILRYIELSEKYLDDKQKILQLLEKKIESLEEQRKSLAILESNLQREYDNLNQGKILELPEYIETYFHENDIDYMYGMDWLKNNNYSATENEKLVESNPFLPYSLILDEKSYSRMTQIREELYTDFPIPIIKRNEIEEQVLCHSHVVTFGKISFFLMFNRHLLDEEKLRGMIEKKWQEIEKNRQEQEQRKIEQEEYRNFYQTVSSQNYTAAYLDGLKKELQKENDYQKHKSEELLKLDKDLKENRNEEEKSQKQIQQCVQNLFLMEQKRKDFESILKTYDEYLENCRRIDVKNKKLQEIENDFKQLKQQKNELEVKIEKENQEKIDIDYRKKQIKEKLTRYDTYDAIETEEENVKLEARYDALTVGNRQQLQHLEKSYKREKERYESKKSEFDRENKYGYAEGDLKNQIVSDTEKEFLEQEKDRCTREDNNIHNNMERLSAEIKGYESQIEKLKERMKEDTDQSEPLDKKYITDIRFKVRRDEVNHKKSGLESEKKLREEDKHLYESIRISLDEYSDFKRLDCAEKENFEEIDNIREYSGKMRKTLNYLTEQTNIRQKETEECIRGFSQREIYSEDYFKKSFVNLLATVNQAHHLKKQLEISIQIYTNQLERLKVDLENIEIERKNVEEVLMDYIRIVDENIKKIDKNSTIHIRNRNIKMLTIQTMNWEINKEQYNLKLKDYMNHIIERGLEVIAKNENIGDKLGLYINTIRLYDEVVGIGNIKIKLYKIEEEKEVQISWKEVSANSGGEGFLSAFVVLTCLMSYMRKSDADVFARGEQGKVLIMDNPFAQTNAVHLLKPLMEMAKKTNTQLICLSGLGGDSIYNRFDNIYVLKLENSGIHTGLQYMTPEHIKGDEIKKMRLSEFKIEQMNLFEVEN